MRASTVPCRATVSAAEPVDPALCQPLRFDRACLEKVWGGRTLEETPGIELEIEQDMYLFGPESEEEDVAPRVEEPDLCFVLPALPEAGGGGSGNGNLLKRSAKSQ